MLVISRRDGESVIINGDIRVTVLQRKGKVTRLGIEAPKEVPIHRSELHQQLMDRPLQIDLNLADPEELIEMGAQI